MFGARKKKFVNDCFEAFKAEFESEFNSTLSFNEEGDCWLNHFGIHYYDKGNITFENRVTYNTKEYNDRHPLIQISTKNSNGLQNKILDKIMKYLKETVEKEHPEYVFCYQWILVDARTDYEIICTEK